MKYRATRRYSALMLAAGITLAHFSVSSATNLPKSAGDPPDTVAPRSARRVLIPASARAALISLLSLSVISGGVFLGAATPNQVYASKPGRKEPIGGTSGSASARVALLTAS